MKFLKPTDIVGSDLLTTEIYLKYIYQKQYQCQVNDSDQLVIIVFIPVKKLQPFVSVKF